MRKSTLFVLLVVASAPAAGTETDGRSLDELIAVLRSIGHEGKNGAAAATAARDLGRLPAAALPDLLDRFDGLNPLAANLLRSAVESIGERAAAGGGTLPREALEAFVRDASNSPQARRLAYELLAKADPSAADRIIPGLLTDPNADFRRDAVARLIAEAEAFDAADKKDEAKAAYEKALSGAVHEDQVRAIVKGLKAHGVTVDLPRHFGFVTAWKALGPFDNRGGVGFEAVYPPETKPVDYDAAYQGQLGEIRWRPITTDDDYGAVDVAKTFENWKGSVTYLATEFRADADRAAEIRIATPNAWKLWVNGDLAFAREEYHRGMRFDQYRVPVTLKKGKNVFLLKLLQNEQTQDWAQGYTFRLRVSDAAGSSIPPAK